MRSPTQAVHVAGQELPGQVRTALHKSPPHRNSLRVPLPRAASPIDAGRVSTHASPTAVASSQRTRRDPALRPVPTTAPVATWVEEAGIPTAALAKTCLLYTSPSPRDGLL